MSTMPDAKRAQLRTMVAAMDAVIGEGNAPLLDAWRRLVVVLDLGPAPEVRTCPKCGGIGMRAATLCGHCWIGLVPPTA